MNGTNGEVIVKVGTDNTVQLPGSQMADNTVKLISTVVDGANAVGLSVDTVNPLVTSGAKLATFGNGGTNVTVVTPWGGIVNGAGYLDNIGIPQQRDSFVHIGTKSIDGSNRSRIFTGIDDSLDFNFGAAAEQSVYVDDADESYGYWNLNGYGNGFGSWEAHAGVNGGVEYGDFYWTGTTGIKLKLFPTAPDGTTPYIYDSSLTHTSGFLKEVKNHGTAVFKIGIAGEIVLTPMTKAARNALTPAAGMIVFQSDNTPGLRCYNGTDWVRYTETVDA